MRTNPTEPMAMTELRAHTTPSLADNVWTYLHDALATAWHVASTMRRYPSWLLNLSIGPFLAILPFVFLGDTLVGRGNRLAGTYFDKLGYEGYVGYLVVPMIAVALSNTVFSWISGLLRMERRSGTLERILVSVQFPSALFLGRALAHLAYMSLFVLATLLLVTIWIEPDFDVNVPSAIAAISLHLAATYGLAFALSSLLLRVADAWSVQIVLSRAVLALLSGATFPIAIFPEWLQVIARMVPFTWAFDLERRSLLRAEHLAEMWPDLLVLGAMSALCWLAGFFFLGRELDNARRTGVLGSF